MPGPTPPTADRIARVLLDAEEHGDAEAARLHRMGERTVRLWRARYAARPDVAGLCREMRARITAGWIDAARDLRLVALRRLETLVQKKGARLRDVAGAMTAVHQLVLSAELVDPAPATSRRTAGALSSLPTTPPRPCHPATGG